MFNYRENEAQKGRPSWWFLEGYTDFMEHHPSMREGYARYHMYSNLPVYINPGDCIAGNLNWSVYREIIFNNVGSQVINEEVLKEFMGLEDVSDTEKDEVRRRIEIMRPHTHNNMEDRLPENLRAVSKSTAGMSTYFNGHMVFDYEQILDIGLDGYRERLLDYMSQAKDREGYFFYKGLLYALTGMQEFIGKHIEMAACLLENRTEGYEEDKLRLIIRNCRKIKGGAPDTFLEALQLVWFIFCFGDYDSYGRFDQYMYPFYKKAAENLSESDIKSQLSWFLKKGEENRGILNMTVGGKKADGGTAVTEFTYLVMDVIRELGYKSPNLCLRISAESEEKLFRKAHENLSTGQAIPALYNDDVIIPMLLELGYSQETANTYCLAGCSQVVLPGNSNFCCDVGCFNALKMLEITLHGGKDLLQNETPGISQDNVMKCRNFEEFYQLYLEQMRYLIACGVEINHYDIESRKDMPASVRTLFIDGCLESGRSIFQGGAVYNSVQHEVIGLTNVANAMMVIKKLVFEEQSFTLEELVHMMDVNYAGYERELKEIMAVPKFGNDIDEVDELRVRVGTDFYKELGQKDGYFGGRQWPGEVVFQSHINLAPFTLASPDGRKAFEPLADSAGAMRGTDTNGPTALIKSICKIPVTAPTVSRNLNIRFPKTLFAKQQDKIISLFRAFLAMKGVQMQINVLNKEDLLEAQENPEDFRDLIVRIGGYNDYFVEIPREMQDEVIARTEQEL